MVHALLEPDFVHRIGSFYKILRHTPHNM